MVSLLVYVVVTDASGEESELGESLAAGFESWHTEVWGSPQGRALGAEFFPRLGQRKPKTRKERSSWRGPWAGISRTYSSIRCLSSIGGFLV